MRQNPQQLFCWLCGTVLAASLSGKMFAAPELPQGKWSEPAVGYAKESFTLGAGETRRSGWGAYSPNERHYFGEFLPALFERTLDIDSLETTRGLKWIFTGDRASLTVQYQGPGKELQVGIEFYDSPAFNTLVQKPGGYPRLAAQSVAYLVPTNRCPRALTVRLDHTQTLTVLADGLPIFTNHWMHTFSRHQLQLTGTKGEASFRLLSPETRVASVSVDLHKPHQTMLGWGGIGTPTAYQELSPEGRRQWWHYVAEYNLLLQREYPVGSELHEGMDNWDHLEDAKAHYYGDNFPNGEVSNFAYNRAIQKLGGAVVFEFWNFPPWVGENAARYAAAMLNYCQTAKARTGQAPFAVGMQNEVKMKPELVEPFVTALRQTLDDHGFKEVKIHMANATDIKETIRRLEPYRKNSAVWNKLDFAASNLYDVQNYFRNPDQIDQLYKEWRGLVGDRPFMGTEICINNGNYQNDGYLCALSYGEFYHKLLTLTDAIWISYCWTILNVEQPSYAMSRSLFGIDRDNGFVPKTFSPQLRIYGAYSRHIRRDMVRVEAASTDTNLLATAFQAGNVQATLVLLNRGLSSVKVQLDWPIIQLSQRELTDPYHQNSLLGATADSTEPVVVPAGAILTLSNVPLLSLPDDFTIP